LIHPSYKPEKRHTDGLITFLLNASLPNDLRVALHKDLLRDASPEVKAMLRDKRLATLILSGM
jgi:hypothetical protein